MTPTEAMRQADALAAAIARAERAERALRGAGWVDNGGAEWKPPLGAVPRSLLATLDAYRDDMERLRADLKHCGEQWDATSATLAAVCKALGCDVDSVQAQAAMFREKATTLLQERDDARKAAAEVDRAGGDAPHEPCMGLAAWIRCRGEMQRAAEARAEKAEAELAAINAELAETDESPSGVAGVRHHRQAIASFAMMVAQLQHDRDAARARAAAENQALFERNNDVERIAKERDAARAELAKWPSLIAEALSTRVGGRDIAPEEWAGHVRREHEAHTRTSSCLDAARAEVERLQSEVAGLRAHLDAKTADHKHVSEQWDATSATLAAVCKALGCDVDSVQAQAAMFREKATTLRGQLERARAEIARLNADLAASQRAAEIARSECQAEVDRARAELVAERAAAERAAALWQKRIERLLDFPMVVVNGADVSDLLEQLRTRAEAEAAEQELAELRQPAKPDRAASDAEGDGA